MSCIYDVSASVIARCGGGGSFSWPEMTTELNRPVSRRSNRKYTEDPILPVSTAPPATAPPATAPPATAPPATAPPATAPPATAPPAPKHTTQDDLVARLNDVRRIRHEQRLMKSVCHRGIWDEDDEDVVSSPKQKKLYDRNTPKNAFDYVNKYLLLGAIEHVPHAYANENAICELLYDLSTFPLPSVLDKLRQNGFIIL